MQLGVGVGWLEEEFDSLGVPFAERGRRTDEHVAVMRRSGGGSRRFDGEFTRFGEAIAHPVPAQGSGGADRDRRAHARSRPAGPDGSATGSSRRRDRSRS